MPNQFERRGGREQTFTRAVGLLSARFNTNPFLLVKHYNNTRNQRLDFLTPYKNYF